MEAAAVETRKLRWSISILLFLKYQLAGLAVSGFLVGIVVLVLRAILTVGRQQLLWSLAAFLPAAAWGLVAALKRIPSGAVLHALVDAHGRCGGLIMASCEVPLDAWRADLARVRPPALKWRSTRGVGLALAALTFLAATFLLPDRYVQITSAAPLNISQEIDVLQKQIDTLRIEEVIASHEADALRSKLEQIRREASGSDPVKTWESLDHLEQSLARTAADFGESQLSRTEALAKTEALAQGLDMVAEMMTPEEIAQAMSSLAEMMKSLLAENDKLRDALSSDCLAACEQGGLTAEQLSELLKALRDGKAAALEKLGRLCEAGLIDVEMLALCEKMGECSMEGLAAYLAENASMGMAEALCLFCMGPGDGGISRGPGAAPMTWTEAASEEGTAFENQILPPASLQALRESILVGVSVGDPTAPATEHSQDVRVLNPEATASGEAFKQVILPRHKGAVERYFSR